MEINKLSAQIDRKLIELDQRLGALTEQLKRADISTQAQLETDIHALELTKDKLIKSRDIAWRAHRLQSGQDERKQLERRRQIGLALCVLSVIGALVLSGIFWWTEIR